MNWDAYKRELIGHYAEMAALPGWKEQAWYSVNDLARQHPQFFEDLPKLLTVAMAQRKQEAAVTA